MKTSKYWVIYATLWFLINFFIAFVVHGFLGIPWHKCFNLYTGALLAVVALFKAAERAKHE